MKDAGDSAGGIATCVIRNVPIGLGEPCFDKVSETQNSAAQRNGIDLNLTG